MTELKDILRTIRNEHIRDTTLCLIVYLEQGKLYLNKKCIHNNHFKTNGVIACLTEDEVLDMVEKIHGRDDYNFDENKESSGTVILTDPNAYGRYHKFSVRRFTYNPNGFLFRLRWRYRRCGTHSGEEWLSCRYEKEVIITPQDIFAYIKYRDAITQAEQNFIKDVEYIRG
jgi:hypothetical protein